MHFLMTKDKTAVCMNAQKRSYKSKFLLDGQMIPVAKPRHNPAYLQVAPKGDKESNNGAGMRPTN